MRRRDRGGLYQKGIGAARVPLAAHDSPRGPQAGAVYLVRPDGYIGLADPAASPARLEQYLDTRGVQP